jgi:parvulin-like peptidyl-prolyl isomerase
MNNQGRLLLLFFAGAAVMQLSGCHTKPEEILAHVNGKIIFAADFHSRYKQYLESTSQRDNIVLRKRILDNMIGEVLIYDELHRQGLDRDSIARNRLDDIKREALAMGYAKKITLDTMFLTHEEVMAEYQRSKIKYHARYLYAKTEEDAWKLRARLERGETYESLAREIFEDPGLASNGGDLGFIGWGEMEPALERTGYAQPIGELSEPVKLKVGYAIIRIEERVDAQPLASETDFEKVKPKLESAVTKKKIFSVLETAAAEVVKALAPKFNESAVKIAFANWKSVVEGEPAGYPNERIGQIDQSDTVLMEFGQGQKWTLKVFFGKLRHTTKRLRKYLHSEDDLKKYAIGLAAQDVMVSRALETGVENDTSVTAQIKRLSEEFLLRRWASSVQDTVGSHGWDERFLKEQYLENQAQYAVPPLVNVAEILVRTKDEALTLSRRVIHGEDFGAIARTHSIRLWAAKQGGELGYGPKASYGIYADTLANARIGQIIGPLFVDPYFGVFKVIGKKDGRVRTFDEAREDVIKGTGFSKKQEALKTGIMTLRAHATVEINNSLLENISLTEASK